MLQPKTKRDVSANTNKFKQKILCLWQEAKFLIELLNHFHRIENLNDVGFLTACNEGWVLWTSHLWSATFAATNTYYIGNSLFEGNFDEMKEI